MTAADPRDGLPAQDTSKPNTEQGLFLKFDVRRTDGSDAPGGKHDGCEYFVLDVTHDPHAKTALAAYAAGVETTHPHLAADMRQRYDLAHARPEAVDADTRRLDALEADVAKHGPLILHNGERTQGVYRGLGLSNTGRTLRQALDPLTPERAP